MTEAQIVNATEREAEIALLLKVANAGNTKGEAGSGKSPRVDRRTSTILNETVPMFYVGTESAVRQ